VIYHKAFGNQVYESTEPLKKTDIFDLASITKISTSVPALMKWQDEGKFSLGTTMGQLIPELANSNKKNLAYLDVLTHQARLRAWIPFWQDYIDSTDMIVHSKKFTEQYAKDELKYSFVEKYLTKSAGEERVKKAITQRKDLWASCVDLKMK